jgi:hypothetical protein
MMFQFLYTKVETMLMAIKEYVYCLWQICILRQFILVPLCVFRMWTGTTLNLPFTFFKNVTKTNSKGMLY